MRTRFTFRVDGRRKHVSSCNDEILYINPSWCRVGAGIRMRKVHLLLEVVHYNHCVRALSLGQEH